MASVWSDVRRYGAALWGEWRKLLGTLTFIVGWLLRTIPYVERSPIRPFITPLFVVVSILAAFWATFSVFRKQLHRIEELSSIHVSPLGIIQIEKLLGEVEHNYERMQKQGLPYQWRDEGWQFVNEGSLALNTDLRGKIAAFYREVRSGKEAYHLYSSNSARQSMTAPHLKAALQLAEEIIPELRAVVSTARAVERST